ncbi:MAG: hypothetical protein ACHQYR_03825 [Candidatus Gagatemarchaeaceae archaeon]
MSNELQALALAAGLVGCVGGALYSKKVSTSLILLFYASLFLGLTFTFYGDALLGLLTMVTFAGAISVLLLTVILITGESALPLGAKRAGLALVPSAAIVGAVSLYSIFQGQGASVAATDVSLAVMSFAWSVRPWDLLVLVVVFAAAMIGVVNLLGRER